MKKHSEACERNKEPLNIVLRNYLSTADDKSLLEIGSGSGQHAAFFSSLYPKLQWQTADLSTNHESINTYRKECSNPNFLQPILLDLNYPQALESKYDFVFSANVLHIVSPVLVENFFKISSENLNFEGKLFIYGPFKYKGNYTSKSNENFDIFLKENVSQESGIRDIEWILSLAKSTGFQLLSDQKMPANNQFLVLTRI